MSNPNKNKPGGKPGQRSPKPEQARSQKPVQPLSLKAEPSPSQKPVQPLSLKPAQPQSQKPVQLPSLPPEPVQQQSKTPVQQQDGSKPFDAARMPNNTPSIDFQTIATAYSDYSKKSFEQTKAFVEKLSGVRSLDKAIEIQTEFAKQAYETFVTESQKIHELYSGFAKQTFQPLESLVAKATHAAR
jgi:Phasin protein